MGYGRPGMRMGPGMGLDFSQQPRGDVWPRRAWWTWRRVRRAVERARVDEQHEPVLAANRVPPEPARGAGTIFRWPASGANAWRRWARKRR
ncbi:hypothetical protein MSAN_01361900 [Mycena sanguinolenta]|uniref:Uncharacterized protein n=1 Tax=Mycena sanguinolenta TaxID=230812 RepID=A0A8H6YDE0_9AGAR|nr:hypothetical protein MSAN_01361900 [Mycena sanguinolenta]